MLTHKEASIQLLLNRNYIYYTLNAPNSYPYSAASFLYLH